MDEITSKKIDAAMSKPVRSKIVEKLFAYGPMSPSQLARILDYTRESMSRNMVDMHKEGLLDRRFVGGLKNVRYEIAGDVLQEFTKNPELMRYKKEKVQ